MQIYEKVKNQRNNDNIIYECQIFKKYQRKKDDTNTLIYSIRKFHAGEHSKITFSIY